MELFEAQTSRRTGRPMARAYQPARMLPKLPVGTHRSTSPPAATAPRATSVR